MRQRAQKNSFTKSHKSLYIRLQTWYNRTINQTTKGNIMTTKYTLQVNGEATEFARSTKATVVAEADRLRKSGVREGIEVVTGAGHVAYALKAIKSRVITFHTKPYTKTITLDKEIASLVPKGYTAAYARLRNGAVVGRNLEADEDERYVVVAIATGEVAGHAATTREAGQIMKGLKPAKVA